MKHLFIYWNISSVAIIYCYNIMAIHNRSIYRAVYRVGTNVLSTQNYTDTETADQLIMMYTYTQNSGKCTISNSSHLSTKINKINENIWSVTSKNRKLCICRHLPEPGFTTTLKTDQYDVNKNKWRRSKGQYSERNKEAKQKGAVKFFIRSHDITVR